MDALLRVSLRGPDLLCGPLLGGADLFDGLGTHLRQLALRGGQCGVAGVQRGVLTSSGAAVALPAAGGAAAASVMAWSRERAIRRALEQRDRNVV